MVMRTLLLCIALGVIHASSKPMEKKDRVHEDVPLSSKEHHDDENFDYDHEAFLGQDEAKTFDQLTPEESKERLGYGCMACTFTILKCVMYFNLCGRSLLKCCFC